jgi:protein SCO1
MKLMTVRKERGVANSVQATVARAAMVVGALGLALVSSPGTIGAQLQDPLQSIGVRPELLKDVGIDQKLNNQIPLDLTFRDEHGRPVQLTQYFGHGKPVILTLVYYNCPMLCTQVLNGVLQSLKDLRANVGEEFEVLTVSIDPTEKPVLASAKHELYTGIYGRPGAADGWHFLTGDEPQIKQLANAVGFRYAYDADSKQFAHASVIIVLTPRGRVSRYFYGIQYPARDLRFGLMEASEGKIGSPVDAILLFCYHYDPVSGKYGLVISHVVQIAGALTVLAIVVLVFFLARSEHYALPERGA